MSKALKTKEAPMSPVEIGRLESIETDMEKSRKAFVEFGNNLVEIQVKRLWRRDYNSWDAYCQNRWGLGRTQAQKYMRGAGTIKALPPTIAAQIPDIESANRLSRLEPDKMKSVIKAASKDGPATRESIKEAMPEAKPAPKAPSKPPEPPKRPADKLGFPIPDESLELWERQDDAKELLSTLSALRSAAKTRSEATDKMTKRCYHEVNWSVVTNSLAQADAELKRAVPFAVCTCGGIGEACKLCDKAGMVSKFTWDTCISKEFKEMREKAVKSKN
jgi:hypothetical protein